MNRRRFLTSIIAAGVAPMILPGNGRIWKPNPDIITPGVYTMYYVRSEIIQDEVIFKYELMGPNNKALNRTEAKEIIKKYYKQWMTPGIMYSNKGSLRIDIS